MKIPLPTVTFQTRQLNVSYRCCCIPYPYPQSLSPYRLWYLPQPHSWFVIYGDYFSSLLQQFCFNHYFWICLSSCLSCLFTPWLVSPLNPGWICLVSYPFLYYCLTYASDGKNEMARTKERRKCIVINIASHQVRPQSIKFRWIR